MKYVALLRGINVGGKNKVRQTELQRTFESLGFKKVKTYIQSGNVIFESSRPASAVTKSIEAVLPKKFKLDSNLIKAFVFTKQQFQSIVKKAPKGFGKQPGKYYYDFIFLKDVTSRKAASEFEPNPNVDAFWTGLGVIYHRRLAAKRAQSRLAKIAGKPIYKNMTIRSGTTTTKLLALLDAT